MKVNFNAVFKDCFGNPIVESRYGESAPQEVWRVVASKLFGLSVLGGTMLSPDQKYMAYELSMRISGNPSETECTTEEASFIKDVCAEQLSAGAYGQVVDMIENNNQ